MAANHLDTFTRKALGYFGHEGSQEHYRRLRDEKQLYGTRCDACSETCYPPRSFCPDCFSDTVTWVPIGDGATLYSFTTQTRALRFTAPEVIGVVDIPDVGLIVSPIGGTLGELKIGQPMTLEVVELGDDLVIHRFVPT
jgi:uncharacterized OB-fold protein